MTTPTAIVLDARETAPTGKRSLQRFIPFLLICPTIALTLSGFITWLNTGLAGDFAVRWLHAFISAIPIMFMSLVLIGALEQVVRRLFSRGSAFQRKLIQSVLAAIILEALMACVVTLLTHGAGAGFGAVWLAAFVKSLPLGFAIGVLMGFVVSPWIQRTMAD